MGKTRYAIYFVPGPDTPLGCFGARWLGRDITTQKTYKPPSLEGIDKERIAEITAAPRHYGFHATLKPPFHLADGYELSLLDEALEAFVAAECTFEVPALELAELDDFIALRPKKPCKALQRFAETCVRNFDPFRAPPAEQETAKRLQADLTDKQIKMFKKWGYPYVMDEYRFHMTLTDRLKDKERNRVMAALNDLARSALTGKKWTFESIALVRQKAPDEPFLVIKTYPLARHLPSGRWPVKK